MGKKHEITVRKIPETKSEKLKSHRRCVSEKLKGVEAPEDLSPRERAKFTREMLAKASKSCAVELREEGIDNG